MDPEFLSSTTTNIYKYFLTGYDYCVSQIKKTWNKILPRLVMIGMRCALYIMDTAFVKRFRQCFLSKRHRKKDDIREEPILENVSDSWICTCELIDCHSSFSLRDCLKKKENRTDYHLLEHYSSKNDFHDQSKYTKKTSASHLFISHFFYKEKPVKISSIHQPIFTEIINPVISKVKFLDIQYIHPDMSVPLILELSKDYYYHGNELFSNAFVNRLLLYQPFPFVFDDRYTLEIMDKDLNCIVLYSYQYLVLEESGYRVV